MSGLDVDRLAVAGQQVTFSARPGSTVALLGPPDSAASALLQAIAGLRRPDSGTVLLDGAPVHARAVGVMPRPVRLFPELTATENVAVPLLARGAPPDPGRIERALAAMQLAPASRTNLVEQLSGGQQQRVAIARALVTDSALLCLDEPVTELDEATVGVVLDAIRTALADVGIAVIATVDRELAIRLDQVVVSTPVGASA